ncbi:helix-turn-helix domain-containing protein [Paenibacillus sepulcri]|uniref:AraC family transcriptional regulator n=1 Tax=Paenibacillus sepulcri TaxID=359917 RepID=A0ABS7CBE3_9BACL|nr:AraC family transcriptional regulator [Paenibacillus sepulcri]
MSIRVLMNGRELRVEHVTTDKQQHRTGSITTRHRHPVFHFMYITEGEGSFAVDDRRSKAEPGLLYIINPNEWHEFQGDEARPLSNLECTFLVLDGEGQPFEANFLDWISEKRGSALPDSMRDGPVPVPPLLQPFLLEGFHRLLEPSMNYVTPEHLSLMVMDLMLRTEETLWRIARLDTESARSGAETVAVLKHYMKAHMKEHITLEELSHLAHWTPNYLCRIFKEHTGETPMTYLQRVRMTEAEKLLLYTDLPVYAIAEMLGYEDASYFARVFRQQHGRAPTNYRII